MCNEKKIKKECASNEYDDHRDYERGGDSCDAGAAQESEQKGLGCCQQLTDLQDKYAHVLSDLQNFRQRVEKERMQWSITAQTDVVKKILPVVDDFDRAIQESAKGSDSDRSLVAGFMLIYKSLLKMLDSIGVQVMTDFTVFDPEKHEAIMQVDAEGHASGDIVDVIEKGYIFKGEVLRPAKVSVAR